MKRTLIAGFALAALGASATGAERHIEGAIASGARYVFDVPENWNGTLLLYSKGYGGGGPAGPAHNAAGDEKSLLLARGYALAGSSYSKTGWAVEEAITDQLATLDAFIDQVGKPKKSIAWGSSMGGLITLALLERHGQRFDAGLALCASASGTVGMMNAALDGAWVLKNLTAPDSALPVLFGGGGEDGKRERAAWQAHLASAQATPAGRARIALAAVLAQVPTADPAIDIQLQLSTGVLPATLMPRSDQLRRAGGNFSWNTGIDYAAQLAASGRTDLIRALYDKAGIALEDDLARLAKAPRIAADPAAIAYMKRNYAPTGKVAKPILLVQTVADPVTLVELTGDYGQLARSTGKGELVREAYVQRIGHCNFKSGETVAAIGALDQRTGQRSWDQLASPAALNRAAPGGADFVDYRPAPFLRSCPGDQRCKGE